MATLGGGEPQSPATEPEPEAEPAEPVTVTVADVAGLSVKQLKQFLWARGVARSVTGACVEKAELVELAMGGKVLSTRLI